MGFDRVVGLIENKNFDELHSTITGMPFGDLVALLSWLDSNYLEKVANLFPIIIDPFVLGHLPLARRNSLMLLLTEDNLKRILQRNDEDGILNIIEAVSGKARKRVLSEIPENFVGAFKIRSKYSDDQVGRYMSLSYVTLPSFWTCAEALDYIVKSVSNNVIRNKHFSRIYVVNPRSEPVGYITLSELMACHDKNVRVEEITNHEIQIVRASDSSRKIYQLFRLFRCLFLVIVDRFGRMVGVVNYQQAISVIEERAAESVLDIGGVGESYSRSISFFSTCFDRVKWLALALANSVMSALVIAHFKGVIEEKIALAIIMPIIASLGGNVGIQTLSVVLRALSHGVYGSKIVWKEVVINIINGILLGSVASIVVGVVFHSISLGLVVAAAMFFNMIWSAFIGSVMPIIISGMGYDETISSGPIITSINDVFGFAIFLGIADIFL